MLRLLFGMCVYSSRGACHHLPHCRVWVQVRPVVPLTSYPGLRVWLGIHKLPWSVSVQRLVDAEPLSVNLTGLRGNGFGIPWLSATTLFRAWRVSCELWGDTSSSSARERGDDVYVVCCVVTAWSRYCVLVRRVGRFGVQLVLVLMPEVFRLLH